jgi:hypothetical protein
MPSLPLSRLAFQFPDGEAPDVEVGLVPAWHGIVLKLNLEFHLGAGHRRLAYGAGSPYAGDRPKCGQAAGPGAFRCGRKASRAFSRTSSGIWIPIRSEGRVRPDAKEAGRVDNVNGGRPEW